MAGLMDENRWHSGILTNFRILLAESRLYWSRGGTLGVRRHSRPTGPSAHRLLEQPAADTIWHPPKALPASPKSRPSGTAGLACGECRTRAIWGSTRYTHPPSTRYTPTPGTHLPHPPSPRDRTTRTHCTCTYDRFKPVQGDPRGVIRTGHGLQLPHGQYSRSLHCSLLLIALQLGLVAAW